MFRITLKNGVIEIKKELTVTLIFDIFAFAYWYSARKLSATAMMFPMFLLIGIAIFSIMSFIQGIHLSKELNELQHDGEEINFGITKKASFVPSADVCYADFLQAGWVCYFNLCILTVGYANSRNAQKIRAGIGSCVC